MVIIEQLGVFLPNNKASELLRDPCRAMWLIPMITKLWETKAPETRIKIDYLVNLIFTKGSKLEKLILEWYGCEVNEQGRYGGGLFQLPPLWFDKSPTECYQNFKLCMEVFRELALPIQVEFHNLQPLIEEPGCREEAVGTGADADGPYDFFLLCDRCFEEKIKDDQRREIEWLKKEAREKGFLRAETLYRPIKH